MGEIVGAGFLAHVPPLMMTKEQRYALNEGKEISLVPGLKRIRDEVLDELRPDVVIIFDTHWFTTVEVVVTSHARRTGKYTSEELPRGISQVPYDLTGDPELAGQIAAAVTDAGVRCTPIDDPCLPIHYPTVNLAHYLHRPEERWMSISTCQTAVDDEFLTVGAGLANAIAASNHRVAIIASGGMSHRFWPLALLPLHEASDPIHIRTPQARAEDEKRLAWWKSGDHASVIDHMDDYRPHKPEGFFGHYLMMVGALGGRNCTAAGRQFSDYESTTGTGQVHMWFDPPSSGWTG